MSIYFSVEKSKSADDYAKVLTLREEIYRQAGKINPTGLYISPIDMHSEIFLVKAHTDVTTEIIGTFSIYRNNDLNQEIMTPLALCKQFLKIPDNVDMKGIYIYFLGLKKSYRSFLALKFIFAEIFKYLYRNKLEYICLACEEKLVHKYKLIGFSKTGNIFKGPFPKSGALSVMCTKQTRFGLYGLHADPLRWNIYLRKAIAELRVSGEIPKYSWDSVVYVIYSLFSYPALGLEWLITKILRFKKIRYQDFSQVQSIEIEVGHVFKI